MSLTPVKTPLVVKKTFPNYVWSIPTTSKTLYLTFDDGPTPEITDWTLQTLQTYNAKATFFCIGYNVEKHPNIFHNIIKAGHSIGNHTYNHLNGWKSKTMDYISNVKLCDTIMTSQVSNVIFKAQDSKIENYQFKTVNLFRPPYGKIKPKQSKRLLDLGYQMIMWDILSFDWDSKVSPKDCLNQVVSKSTNGSIIVFHDSIKAAKNMQYTLPKVLDHFSNKGFCFKAIT